MSHVVDLTGMDFGYLHVIGRDTSKKRRHGTTEEEKIRPRPAAGRLRDLLQPTLPDAQQLPRRLELHRVPLLPGTQICPPVEAGDHHNLKGVSKWQKSWARLRTT